MQAIDLFAYIVYKEFTYSTGSRSLMYMVVKDTYREKGSAELLKVRCLRVAWGCHYTERVGIS